MRTDAHGYFWPDSDVRCGPGTLDGVPLIKSKWLPHVAGRNTAVQAGGNCGLYPLELSKHFKTVYTFEPDAENFACLVRNCPAPNVYKFQAAIGRQPSGCDLVRDPENVGAHYMKGMGTIPVLALDDLPIRGCDLLALDTEGAEFDAMCGAVHLITRFHPTIIWEGKHIERFGKTRDDVVWWLDYLGYQFAEKVGLDEIWLP